MLLMLLLLLLLLLFSVVDAILVVLLLLLSHRWMRASGAFSSSSSPSSSLVLLLLLSSRVWIYMMSFFCSMHEILLSIRRFFFSVTSLFYVVFAQEKFSLGMAARSIFTSNALRMGNVSSSHSSSSWRRSPLRKRVLLSGRMD